MTETFFYVINENEDKVVERTKNRKVAFNKAEEIWEGGEEGTVAKNPC